MNDDFDNAQTDKEALESAKAAEEAAKVVCVKCGGDPKHPAPDSGMLSGICPGDR